MQTKRQTWLSSLVLVVVAGFVGYAGVREAMRNRQIAQEVAKLRSQTEQAKLNNQEMREKIAYYATPSFQERIAKEKMNMQNPGEKVVILRVTEDAVVHEQTSNQQQANVEIPNYRKWWNLITSN